MKYLKYLATGLVVLILLFGAYAMMAPPSDYESSVVINKPASAVWKTMMDPATLPKWITGLKKTELINGTANTVGAVTKIYVEDQGQAFVIQETIKAVEFEKKMAMEFSMDMMDQDYEITLKEKDGKTTVSSTSHCTGSTLFGKALLPIIEADMEAQEQKNLTNLKTIVESGT